MYLYFSHINAPGNNAVLEGASGILGNIQNLGHSAARLNRPVGFNFLLGMGQHSCSGNPSAELPEHPTAEPLTYPVPAPDQRSRVQVAPATFGSKQ